MVPLEQYILRNQRAMKIQNKTYLIINYKIIQILNFQKIDWLSF